MKTNLYLTISRSFHFRKRNVTNKFVEKIKTHICVFVYDLLVFSNSLKTIKINRNMSKLRKWFVKLALVYWLILLSEFFLNARTSITYTFYV